MILDIIVVLFTALGFYLGFQRGLIKTVFDTLSLIIGVVAALKFAPIVIKYVDQLINVTPSISYLIGLVLAFIIVLALVRFIGRQIESLFKQININFINQIAGGALQGFFFAFLVSLFVLLLGNMKILNQDIKNTSKTYALIEPLPRYGESVFNSLKPVFSEFWEVTNDTLDRIKDKADGSE